MERERVLRMNDDGGGEFWPTRSRESTSPTRLVPISSPPSTAVGVGVNGGVNYVLHTVSKLDTLAGVAIKYGVEVADIKRLNGLGTDLQMFALKVIQIPSPGRYPPSPSLSNGHDTPQRPSSPEQTASSRRHSDLFDSLQLLKLRSSSKGKVSPAMNSLQGYYGLRPADRRASADGFELSVYRKVGAHYADNGSIAKSSPAVDLPLSQYRKSKSLANGLESENGDLIVKGLSREAESSNSDRWFEKLVRRRQRSEADYSSSTEVPAVTGKGSAFRPKSAGRTVSGAITGEEGELNPIPIGLGDCFLFNGTNGVRKSSSTPTLQDPENDTFSSIRPTSKRSSKPDFQALATAAAITRPIFDGLPKPMSRRNKAALD